MSRLPQDMIRQRGAFNTIEYLYRGVRISKNSGRYLNGWVCYVGEMKLSNRILGSTLVEMARYIDRTLDVEPNN